MQIATKITTQFGCFGYWFYGGWLRLVFPWAFGHLARVLSHFLRYIAKEFDLYITHLLYEKYYQKKFRQINMEFIFKKIHKLNLKHC